MEFIFDVGQGLAGGVLVSSARYNRRLWAVSTTPERPSGAVKRESNMPVSSYIIRCPDGALPSVRQALTQLAGVTIGPAETAGLAVVTETASLAETEALEGVLREVPHVLDAVLVYHNFEDLPGDKPPVDPNPA